MSIDEMREDEELEREDRRASQVRSEAKARGVLGPHLGFLDGGGLFGGGGPAVTRCVECQALLLTVDQIAHADWHERMSGVKDELDRAHDARIEAQNPGIDMEQVRAERAERRAR